MTSGVKHLFMFSFCHPYIFLGRLLPLFVVTAELFASYHWIVRILYPNLQGRWFSGISSQSGAVFFYSLKWLKNQKVLIWGGPIIFFCGSCFQLASKKSLPNIRSQVLYMGYRLIGFLSFILFSFRVGCLEYRYLFVPAPFNEKIILSQPNFLCASI
jgi:hypothetical protein